MPNLADIQKNIDTLKHDRERLVAEQKAVNDRLTQKKETSSPQVTERVGNLIRGIGRLDAQLADAEKAYSDTLLAGYNAGDFHAESGDGARPVSYTSGGGPRNNRAKSAFADALLDSGFQLKSKPSVEVSGYDALKSTFMGAAEWDRMAPVLVPRGRDARWLWPSLQRQDAGTATSISDFRQTVRTVTGTVQRAIDAVTDKATLDVTLTMVNEALVQHAVLISSVPNALFESVPQLSAFLQSEGEFQVHKSVDAHVMAQIVAAAPPFGNTGANLIDKARHAVAAMRAQGANPTLFVLNPTDAVTLDTYMTADGQFISSTAGTNGQDPLWGLRIVERIGAGTEPPYLIDPDMLGVLYIGRMRFDADSFTGFSKNLTSVRIETNALFHVRNAFGAYRIAAT